MDSNYNIFDDEYFHGYITSNHVIEVSEKKYAKDLIRLCKAMDMEFGEIVAECKEQQVTTGDISNVGGKQKITMKEFDVEAPDSFVKKVHDEYVNFCQNNGNSNVTINNGIIVVRTFLKHYGVKLSKWRPLEDDKADWNCLTKEDFIFVMKDSSLPHQALITFMLSTGIRIGDCLTFTIRDFMEATSDFHDFTDVNEFIDNAPDDMIGYWDFLPKKTKRYKIRCITLNSAESSNYILQNLRRIKNQYLPRKSKRIKKELKISKDDALFGSQHEMYKRPMTVKGITDQFTLKSHKLHAWRVSQIKNLIAEGKFSEEDFEELEKGIPRFHAHGCRKYFQTTVSNHCGNLRLCALMEGHKMPLNNDPSYIDVKITKEYIKDVYKENLHDHLILENVETRIITSKEGEELRKETEEFKEKVDELIKDNKEKDKLINKLKRQVDNSSNKVKKLLNQIEESPKLDRFDNDNVDMELHNNIQLYIQSLITAEFNSEYYGDEYPFDIKVNKDDENVITELAYDIIVNNPTIYDGTAESLNKVISKSKAKLKLNPKYRDKVEAELALLEKDISTLERVSNVVMEKIKELDLFDNEEELNMFYADVLDYISHNTFYFMGRYLDDDEIVDLIAEIIG